MDKSNTNWIDDLATAEADVLGLCDSHCDIRWSVNIHSMGTWGLYLLLLASMMGIGLTAGRMSAFQIDWNQAIQKRLHVTSNVIALTKEIKLLGVTDVVFRIVQELRR